MARARRIRGAFVITVATQAFAACGGSTSDGGGSGGAGGNAPGCPATFPSNGAPCSLVSGATCRFDQGSCCPAWEARCLGGAWQASASTCNPPPPEPCPAALPTAGSACGSAGACVPPPQGCTYGACADGRVESYASCRDGRWEIERTACTECEGLTACECFARPGCTPLSDGCLCTCDYACPGEPPCDCDCGGGTYLGCTPL